MAREKRTVTIELFGNAALPRQAGGIYEAVTHMLEEGFQGLVELEDESPWAFLVLERDRAWFGPEPVDHWDEDPIEMLPPSWEKHFYDREMAEDVGGCARHLGAMTVGKKEVSDGVVAAAVRRVESR